MIGSEIKNREELVELVNEIGFLPFFSGRIEGFSLEENISYDAWYQGRWSGKIHWDAWDWKGQVLRNKELVYGKLFEKKAGFISLELWPDFCNYRRDGYDFDARFDDGLASYKDKGVVDFITESGAILTREIKDSLNFKKVVIKDSKLSSQDYRCRPMLYRLIMNTANVRMVMSMAGVTAGMMSLRITGAINYAGRNIREARRNLWIGLSSISEKYCLRWMRKNSGHCLNDDMIDTYDRYTKSSVFAGLLLLKKTYIVEGGA